MPHAAGHPKAGHVILTWALALAYGWRWGGMPMTGLRGATLLAAPFIVVFAIQQWGLAIPYEHLPSELYQTMVRYMPPGSPCCS